ncbi:MAG: orotate phosphoribosyltransferase [Ignavibacteriaceae bacterium]|jgi:orotate phosphoribosyltransferase|nr:orotate phosphoribosyltransferase [Ignavibacteriaceae bacterium]MCW8817234.1 orotate phosphoribosyltransferase [Ignavibacteriaceae bacterium]MCW8823561.1 orotate phosphoribosyltransferase [Ignavibacteriaceae bacterium]MCW8960749.1 orotate phosphoribosyltransferase [Ignavibacteriaceae bacterium]MCW9094935.1 orotate phosphoribosyltransferase [Ignavibacteriaceae bacterium]
MTETEILSIFKKTEALLTGHFLLTSGRHSDRYFQCAKVLQYPEHAEKLCKMIANNFKGAEIDTVIAPAIGGLVVGQEVARQLNKRFIFAEREDKKLSLRRGFSLDENEKVLVCEDVVTTGGSVFEVIDIVKSKKAEVVGVGFIVDRSNGKVNFKYPQFSTLKMEVVSYLPDECPLCKEDIELVKPGSRKVK